MAPRTAVREVDGPPAVGTAGSGLHAGLAATCARPAVVGHGQRRGQHPREGEHRHEACPT